MKEPLSIEVIEPALQTSFVGFEEEELAPEAFGSQDILSVILLASARVCRPSVRHADSEKLKVKLYNLWLEGVGSRLLRQR